MDRCATFLRDEDFAYYLWSLQTVSRATGCAVHAYVLMTNHVHLLITPNDASGASRLMRALGIRYVRYFNDHYRRTGTLWEGRYRSTVVDTDTYFFACSRYIERNPQRAALTDDPANYLWSSFRCNASGDADRVVTPHPLYVALGPDTISRSRAYRRMFAEPSAEAVAAVRTAPFARRRLPESTYQRAVAAIHGEASGAAPASDAAM